MGSLHKELVLDDIHAVPARVYADITARDIDSDFNTNLANVDKVVRIDSPVSYYILVDATPAWIELTNTSVIDTFVGLTDTPGAISADLVVQGNAAGTALEFGQALKITASPTWVDLTLTGGLTVDTETLVVDALNNSVGIGISSPDGTLHIQTASAGVINPSTSADDLIVEGSDNTGISIFSPDVNSSRIEFGSPSDITAALISWRNTLGVLTIGTSNAGAQINFVTDVLNPVMALNASGAVLIGATIEDGSALLELESTTRGFLLPRMSKVQRDDISNPATGLMIYNTTVNELQNFNGSVWEEIIAKGTFVVGGNATATVITTQNTFVNLDLGSPGAVAAGNIELFTVTNATTGEIRYDGLNPITLNVSGVLIASSSGGGQRFNFRALKNGSALPSPDNVDVPIEVGNNLSGTALGWAVELVTNDLFRLQVENADGTSNITIDTLKITIT